MLRTDRRWSLIAVVVLGIAGCATQDRAARAEPPTRRDEPAASGETKQESKPTTTQDSSADEKEKVEKERRDLARKLRKAEREMQAGRDRLTRAKMSIEHAQINQKLAMDKAEKELELARRRFATYIEKSVPERLARADLGLAGAQDGFKEAEEEYKQLELMYNEDQFADKTKEIVLERGRRRLERSRKYLEIETSAISTLKNETLPVERIEQEIGVREKEEAIARMLRENAASALDLAMGLFSAEGEIIRLEDELADVRQEIEQFEKKHAEKAKDKPAEPAK